MPSKKWNCQVKFWFLSDPDAQKSDPDPDVPKVLGTAIVVCFTPKADVGSGWGLPCLGGPQFGRSGLSLFSDARSAGTRQEGSYFCRSIISSILNLKLFKFIKQLIYSLTCLNSIGFLYLLRPAVAVWQVLESQSMLWVFMLHWASGSISRCVSVKGGISLMQLEPTESQLTGVSQV